MQPEFTVVSPMYNVSRYLPEYFASLEAQTYGFERLEVILVDDGSTDDTAEVAEAFAARHSNVQVVRKANGGQASARNAGLPLATGTWLTFPDPDDVLDKDYFAVAHDAASSAPLPAMISGRLLMWHENDSRVEDNHALSGRFRDGDSTRNLDQHPSWIQAHVTSGFVQTSIVQDAELRFPEALRLRFEDGSFVSQYLLLMDAPVVAFRSGMKYLYRQRSDSSSTIQAGSANPRKYTDTIRYGYLPIIDALTAQGRSVPRWLQNLFLYDQFWILRASQGPSVRNHMFPEDMYAELEELLPRFLDAIDAERIRTFNVMPVAPWMREALLLVKQRHGLAPVYWGAQDKKRGLRSIHIRFRGDEPEFELRVNGKVTDPRFVTRTGLEYVGRPILSQLTLWVPDDSDIGIIVGEESRQIIDAPPTVRSAFPPAPKLVARGISPTRVGAALKRRLTRSGSMNVARRVAMADPRKARRFANAWVFIDRDVDAGDSAEDMYWWVQENHPEINAWFVVRKGTKDWKRMSARGARLVDYGSADFGALLHHAAHLASSHADRFITDAVPRKHVPTDYVFTFLQHGVIKGDISGWLNSKTLHVFVTSTQDEYDYVTGDSPFRFGTKEVRLTGLPRFDALLERAADMAPDDRDLVVVMPTWRDYLVGGMQKASNDRARVEGFSGSAYARSISGLLHDRDLADVLQRTGRRLVFMPHPNMKPYLADFDVPAHVEVRSYEDTDVREMIVRAAALVTDYSSIAFNAAYLRTPVVYFQFDQDEYQANHTERPAYFSYERDGFGPVAQSVADTVKSVSSALIGGIEETYLDRMELAFPVRDGRNRERVFRAMQEAATRRPLDERSTPARADHWESVRGKN
ncbi:CDP-glycerol glycerophosphotransferase family protein [Microbacterium esteraromaticum]|uniref:bifunctional glycosyltransferase/CDP-glycerol:glycerophosphate glycerophosphotransferase n=1 Tax=Microbacterium esteraromaticum TaxID=57043 RepID=UPI001A90B08B|nr:CDP-glycerol glycerophosphotransferase family protein [Microbacterium esteraromaticum]MBN8425011.1 CDP-glycerol glycerophosphotransferase family protein [Microbacterium esteraromaticum]